MDCGLVMEGVGDDSDGFCGGASEQMDGRGVVWVEVGRGSAPEGGVDLGSRCGRADMKG